MTARFVTCTHNENHEHSLTVGKLYRCLGEEDGQLRVLDDTAEYAEPGSLGGYMFDKALFVEEPASKALDDAMQEVERCHAVLGMIYDDLCALETTLASTEQVLLCPVDLCKFWKHPEWEEKSRYLTEEGRTQADAVHLARVRRLYAWFCTTGKDGRALKALLDDLELDRIEGDGHVGDG